MTILEYLRHEVDSRGIQKEYLASLKSLQAMNGLVGKALQHTHLGQNRAGRLLFIGTALGRQIETTKVLVQAEVSVLIELLKDEYSWELKEDAQKDIAEIEKECLKYRRESCLPKNR